MKKWLGVLLALTCGVVAQSSWEPVEKDYPFLQLDNASIRRPLAGSAQCRVRLLHKNREIYFDLRYNMASATVSILSETVFVDGKQSKTASTPSPQPVRLEELGADNPLSQVYRLLKRRGL